MRTWYDNLVNVFGQVLFKDQTLLELMLVPEGDRKNLITLRNKYIVMDDMADKLLVDEAVRILYDEDACVKIDRNVQIKYVDFSIYVRNDQLHNVEPNRLVRRDVRIAERIKHLLHDRMHFDVKFQYEDSYPSPTRAEGYSCYTVLFSYKTTV